MSIEMIVGPEKKEISAALLVTACDKSSGKMPLGRWIDKGLLRYYDKDKSLVLVDRSGLYMAGLSQARSSKGKIYRDAALVKYRNNYRMLYHAGSQPDTPTFEAAFSRGEGGRTGIDAMAAFTERCMRSSRQGVKQGVNPF
ncbi:hypothetical protein SAMN05216412_11013 [Nitrosospira multiformis]|uniref:Uncharacterized protein n=1 Tax=Nitrosospira multiformis TaxID=1231 RepID=A0A1I0FT43_9PROT|nr:hypothetical protein [Nitrosospira multiformis]SET60717.1 hypothetical protein SAMN05216412_11013 [Nitrosospira multiformis]